jgi:hypothetical protein
LKKYEIKSKKHTINKNYFNKAKMIFDQVCACPSMQIDSMGLLSNNPNSVLHKRQQLDSYVENKEFITWLQSHMDQNKADAIRAQFTDFNSFAIAVREKRKTKPLSFR